MAILDYFFESPGDRKRREAHLRDQEQLLSTASRVRQSESKNLRDSDILSQEFNRNKSGREWQYARQRELMAGGMPEGEALFKAAQERDQLMTAQPLASSSTAQKTYRTNQGGASTDYELGATRNEQEITGAHADMARKRADLITGGDVVDAANQRAIAVANLERNRAAAADETSAQNARLAAQAEEAANINAIAQAQADRPFIQPMSTAVNQARMNEANLYNRDFNTKMSLSPETENAMRQEVLQRAAIAAHGAAHPEESTQFVPKYGPTLQQAIAAQFGGGQTGTNTVAKPDSTALPLRRPKLGERILK